MVVHVDDDRHGESYVTPIVVNANEILPIRRFLSKTSPHYTVVVVCVLLTHFCFNVRLFSQMCFICFIVRLF